MHKLEKAGGAGGGGREEGDTGKKVDGKCKRILSRSMKHAVRYSYIHIYICVYIRTRMHHVYTYTHDTAYRGYRARHNGIPRYINFGAHFSHRSSISSLARAMDSSPFSRLLSLLKCAYPLPPLAPDVLFYPPVLHPFIPSH